MRVQGSKGGFDALPHCPIIVIIRLSSSFSHHRLEFEHKAQQRQECGGGFCVVITIEKKGKGGKKKRRRKGRKGREDEEEKGKKRGWGT